MLNRPALQSRHRLAIAVTAGALAIGALSVAGFMVGNHDVHHSVAAAAHNRSTVAPAGAFGWD